jgi:acetyl esterase/lipase
MIIIKLSWKIIWKASAATILCCTPICAEEHRPALIDSDGVQDAPNTIVAIWPGVAPGSEEWTQKEVKSNGLGGDVTIRNVVTPTLTVFAPEPEKATGAAVIVCPGGGFRFLSWQNEGTQVAQWLQKRGVTAFVLKYRLKETPADEGEYTKEMISFLSNLMRFRDRDMTSEAAQKLANDLQVYGAAGIADGRQAVKYVRQRAKEWGIKHDRIGMIGFSAGAIVTMAAATSPVAEERPNFAAHVYAPVFGEISAPAEAPPLFVLCTADDSLAEASSVRLYSAWQDAGRDAELHIYEKGGHGFGMSKKNLPVDGWIDRFGDWLGQRDIIYRE